MAAWLVGESEAELDPFVDVHAEVVGWITDIEIYCHASPPVQSLPMRFA